MLLDTQIRFFPQPTTKHPDREPHSATITVYNNGERKLSELIDLIVECIDPAFQIYIGQYIIINKLPFIFCHEYLSDCWFLSTQTTKSPDSKNALRLIYPNTHSALNKEVKEIRTEDDVELLKSLTKMSFSLFLIFF